MQLDYAYFPNHYNNDFVIITQNDNEIIYFDIPKQKHKNNIHVHTYNV